MELVKSMLESLPLIIITVGIEYRFAYKTLELKTSKSLTFVVMLLVSFIAGKLNITFQLVGTIDANSIYYACLTFLLFLFLFKGNIIKKLFLAILINYGIPITCYIFIPFANYFFNPKQSQFTVVLQILDYVNTLIAFVLMEFIGNRFKNLRSELPVGYTLYLAVVLVFV